MKFNKILRSYVQYRINKLVKKFNVSPIQVVESIFMSTNVTALYNPNFKRIEIRKGLTIKILRNNFKYLDKETLSRNRIIKKVTIKFISDHEFTHYLQDLRLGFADYNSLSDGDGAGEIISRESHTDGTFDQIYAEVVGLI